MIGAKKNCFPVKSQSVALPVPILLLGALLAVAAFQGARSLYETTEGRYAECARETVRSGSWFDPVLNGKPHWTKPPLTYLAIGGGYRVFGPTSLAARFYLIPCYLITIFGVGCLASRMWQDRETARLSAMMYAAMGLPMFASQCVSTDFPLAAVVVLAQAAFWEAFRTRSRGAVYLTWGLLGVAFLVKGPPALLYLPAMIVTWLRLPRSDRSSYRFFSPAAIILFLGVAASWYVWEACRHPGLMDYWLEDEVVARSLSNKFNRHPEFYMNFVVYLPVLLFGTLPWSGFLVARCVRVARMVREKAVVRGRSVWSGLSDESLWLVWSTAFPMVVFALSRSKLPLYVLPLFAPFAVAIAKLMLAAYRQKKWLRKVVLTTWLATCAMFVVGKAVYAQYPSKRDMGLVHRMLIEKAGLRDPSRLAYLGQKTLNGLSYYYEYVIPPVDPTELAKWAGAGDERYLLAEHFGLEDVRAALPRRRVEETLAFGRWRLFQIAATVTAEK